MGYYFFADNFGLCLGELYSQFSSAFHGSWDPYDNSNPNRVYNKHLSNSPEI